MSHAVRARWIQTFLDVGIVLLIAVLPFIFPLFNNGASKPAITTVVISVVIAGAVALRRRYPLVVLGVVLAMVVPTLVAGAQVASVAVGTVIALYTIASRRPRRTTVIATVITLVTAVGLLLATTDDRQDVEPIISGVVWIALAAAVGDAVRSRRNYVQVLEDRARRAEETREQLARTRVAEERLRIARELHDIVAHHIAVVNIQAGLASRAMSRDAIDTAVVAIDRVGEAARSALDDLSAVLRLLRSPEDVEQRAPTPGLSQVGDLVQTYVNSDDRINWTVRGAAVTLDAAGELTAYRVIQEALTNAAKHGVPGDTHVTISYETDGLVITVSNAVWSPAPGGPSRSTGTGTGFGVVGLHERVGSVGGTVTAGLRPDGRYVVRAIIPYSRGTSVAAEEFP